MGKEKGQDEEKETGTRNKENGGLSPSSLGFSPPRRPLPLAFAPAFALPILAWLGRVFGYGVSWGGLCSGLISVFGRVRYKQRVAVSSLSVLVSLVDSRCLDEERLLNV